LCGYDKFISIIEKNLTDKKYDIQTQRRMLAKIQEHFKNSEIFKPLSQYLEDEEVVGDFLHVVVNCFGQFGEGFAGIDDVPREDRVGVLRKCYTKCSPFSDSEMIQPINERGQYGRTLLHEAVIASDRKAIVELLKKGANPYMVDNNGNTPLAMARFNENENMVGYLMRLGVNR